MMFRKPVPVVAETVAELGKFERLAESVRRRAAGADG